MRGWHGTFALAALLALTAAACGGHGTAVVSSGIPSAWVNAPGWVKVASSSGSIGSSWAHSTYFHVDGGPVRVIGSLTSRDTSQFQWDVALVPRKPGVGAGGVGVKMQKTEDNPAVSGELYFEGISGRPLAAGDYRIAIGGLPGTYSLTVYVHQ